MKPKKFENREENNMKYRVTINQNLKYNETLIGEFDDLAGVQIFVKTIIDHFERVKVSIEVVTDEEGADE